MLIGDIIKHLETGGKLIELSTEKGNTSGLMSYKKLSKAMKAAGFVSKNTGGKGIGWEFAGEGSAPLDKSILDFAGKVSTPKAAPKHTKRIQEAASKHTGSIQDAAHIKRIREADAAQRPRIQEAAPAHTERIQEAASFTNEEIELLKGLAAKLRTDESHAHTAASIDTSYTLYERIHSLPPKDIRRKTINLHKEAAELLDELADQHKALIGEIVFVALQDFAERYK